MQASESAPGSRSTRPGAEEPGLPWWRHRMMWLVVGGPLVVVVAAIATAVVAIRGADQLVDDRSVGAAAANDAQAPALKARNHAATPKAP